MNYLKFCNILNKHIFENEKNQLLQNIVEYPERFIGLFRPTKPAGKILQHLLQSHEIRFGDAFEEIIENILKEKRYKILPKRNIVYKTGTISLDQYFTDNKLFYFIEQKVRDDHDSSKKRGQISNFETKIEILYNKHSTRLVGIMYFIDPTFSKNKNYYIQELKKLKNFYGIDIYLFYGKELFEYLRCSEVWENIITWLKKWKESLPELPEIDFDINPEKSFNIIKELNVSCWRKFLENKELWEKKVVHTIFRNGQTLKLLFQYFVSRNEEIYSKLAKNLAERLNQYYGIYIV